MKLYKLCLLCLLLSYPTIAFSWNDTLTHPEITRKAIQYSYLDNYLKNNLNIPAGIETKLSDLINPYGATNNLDSEQNMISDWVLLGAENEDSPPCRAFNHFHNPLQPWYQAGLTDSWWPVDFWCWGFGIGQYPPKEIQISNLTWATGFIADYHLDPVILELNDWDWDNAREYYYIYLTGRDFQGHSIAKEDEIREKYLARCFRSLGQILHLLQDVSVPAHVRDDFSQGHTDWVDDDRRWNLIKKWIGNRLETHVKIINNSAWFSENKYPSIANLSLTDFWDTDQYSETEVYNFSEGDLNSLGLAEYTNLNFVSEYTIFKDSFPYPKKSSITSGDIKTVTVEDNSIHEVLYLSKNTDGLLIDHFATVSYLTKEIENNGVLEVPIFNLDENCFNDYAELLIPRAIGYSTKVLDYFFRGKITITSLPIIKNNHLWKLRTKIWNKTPNDSMWKYGNNDHLSMTCWYRPEEEGSENYKIIQSSLWQCKEGNCYDIQPDLEEPVIVEFQFPSGEDDEKISVQDIESSSGRVECTLTFRGALGNEQEVAVIGKAFTFSQGTLLLNEEWDNGLTGNYNWRYPEESENPENGYNTNTVTDEGILYKENLRAAGFNTPRHNDSYLDLTNDPIQIKAKTYIEFKIDDLSLINSLEFQRQALILYFNDGLNLQFSLPGQTMKLNQTTATYPISIGSYESFNINDLFNLAQIEIPDQLYLMRIGLIQEIFEADDPDPPLEDYIQRMAVDFIRIVEEN